MAVTHTTAATGTDSGDGLISKNAWNENHTIANDTVTEAMLSIADNTTKNVSTSAHGFTPKAPNDTTKFLRGDGTWSVAPSISSFPTLTQQVNFATGSATAPTMTLGSTPTTGDVIFVAGANVQFPVASVSGAGATWTKLRGAYSLTGAYTVLDLWMGVVGGSPSTTITVTFQSTNTYYIAAAVYRGPVGCVEWTGEFNAANPGIVSSVDPQLPAFTPLKSPLYVTAMFARSQGSPATSGATNITTASAGGDRAFLSYIDTSAGNVLTAPKWTGAITNVNIVAVAASIW